MLLCSARLINLLLNGWKLQIRTKTSSKRLPRPWPLRLTRIKFVKVHDHDQWHDFVEYFGRCNQCVVKNQCWTLLPLRAPSFPHIKAHVLQDHVTGKDLIGDMAKPRKEELRWSINCKKYQSGRAVLRSKTVPKTKDKKV